MGDENPFFGLLFFRLCGSRGEDVRNKGFGSVCGVL